MNAHLFIKLIIITFVFLLGAYFNVYNKYQDGFDIKVQYKCPNLLIQKGAEFYLYNSNLANVPGVNPVRFVNLTEYTEFIDWQRSQGISCPILYFQESYDVQGNPVYRARPSPTDLQGGLPDQPIGEQPITKLVDAGRKNDPYNQNGYPAFDSHDQYIGLNTPLDKLYNDSGSKVSPNPMDANWGGQSYTQNLVDTGYYDDDKVSTPTQ